MFRYNNIIFNAFSWLDLSSMLIAPSLGKQSTGQCYIDIDPPTLQMQATHNFTYV